MKLEELIKVASAAYPDNLIEDIHNDMVAGDGLAEFIRNELKETFDEDASDAEQLGEAVRVMERAEEEVGTVAKALRIKLEEVA